MEPTRRTRQDELLSALFTRVHSISLCIASYLVGFARRPRHSVSNNNNLVQTFDKPLVYAWIIPGRKYWKVIIWIRPSDIYCSGTCTREHMLVVRQQSALESVDCE
jgi:hypothetical protein